MNKNYYWAKNILTIGGYYAVKKYLVQNLGIAEAILIEEFSYQQKEHIKNKTLYSDGTFMTTYDYLVAQSGLKKHQVARAIKNLKDAGILFVNDERKDYNRKHKKYKVLFDKLDKFYKKDSDSVSEHTHGITSYMLYNKTIAQQIGSTYAIIFDDLMTSYINACEDNDFVIDDYFGSAQTKLAKTLNCSPQHLCRKYVPQLKELDLIETQQYGWPKRSCMRINFNKYFELLGVSLEDQEAYKLDSRKVTLAEKATNNILNKVKEISGQDWSDGYFEKVHYIEQRLNDGIKEDDLYDIITFCYNWRKNGPEKNFKYFSFMDLYGKGKCKRNVEMMYEQDANAKEKAELKILAEKIIKKVNEVSNGTIEWKIYDKALDLLKVQKDCQVTDDELLEFVQNRYDWKMKLSGKVTKRGFSWESLFGENKKEDNSGYSCFDSIMAMRNSKTGNYKTTKNNRSKDGVTSETISKKDLEFQKEMKDAGFVF